jgi:hypothetical protein
VDTGDAYRPVPTRHLASIELAGNLVTLTPEGERALEEARAVEPRIRREDTPILVRHVPRSLYRLAVASESRSTRSKLWFVGAPLVVLGGVGLMAGPILTAEGVGGDLRWVWVVVPLAVFLAGCWALWAALGRDSPRPLSTRDKISDAISGIFGITPRTRRRG